MVAGEVGKYLSGLRSLEAYRRLWVDIFIWVVIVSFIKFPLIDDIPVWGTKPLLGYMMMTESVSADLQMSGRVSQKQFSIVRDITIGEYKKLGRLETASLYVINNPELSIVDKRKLIKRMKYNQQVYLILKQAQVELRKELGIIAYWKLVGEIETKWKEEKVVHGIVQKGSGPRTYKIYATRYDAGDRYSVALPDKCLKFANGGLHVCDDKGYSTKQNYYVYLNYKKHTTALVAESGPWNVDDNYWATVNDPTPRRKGEPEAQKTRLSM